jgi:hypothetical protein
MSANTFKEIADAVNRDRVAMAVAKLAPFFEKVYEQITDAAKDGKYEVVVRYDDFDNTDPQNIIDAFDSFRGDLRKHGVTLFMSCPVRMSSRFQFDGREFSSSKLTFKW